MERLPRQILSQRVARLAIASLLGCVCLGVRAEANPYYLGVGQSLGHNSNVYRTTSNETPDKFAVTSLNLGFDQPIGRQRVFANTSIRATRYEDIRTLDNTGYGVNAGLDWSTIERLSGSLGLSSNRALANYAASGDQVQLTKRNLETSSQANLRAQLGVASLLSLNAALSHSEISYTAPEYQTSEVRQNAGAIGITYRPSGLLTLGGSYRVTRGEYPNIVIPGTGKKERFDRNYVDFTSIWVASGLSTITARLSYGRSEFEGQTLRNVKGATGSLGWDWKATGKLAFNTSLSRDSGTETALYALVNNLGSAVGDNSVLTNAFGFGATYEASAKIRATLGARYARRELVSGSIIGRDSTSSYSMGASYAASRSWQLGCSASRDDSKPLNNTVGVSTRYSATQASCNVQFTIR